MPWLVLLIAGLFETGWAIGLKYSQGFTRPWPTAATIAAMAVSLTLLGIALRDLPVGTAYTIWVGVGAVGTVILGIFLFDDATSLGRMVCVGLILTGIIGLKVLSPS